MPKKGRRHIKGERGEQSTSNFEGNKGGRKEGTLPRGKKREINKKGTGWEMRGRNPFYYRRTSPREALAMRQKAKKD